MKSVPSEHIDELYEVILKLGTLDECRQFLGDLLTEHELHELADRWRVARMLTDGESYSTIEKETGASSRTIARVNNWLKEGTGGYRMMLKKMRPK
ncbi:MAG: YerC/YecD family TrpR-related protein [Candidatus Kapaibacterium sp.]